MNTVEPLPLEALTTYSVNYDIPWQMPRAMDAREGLAVLGGGRLQRAEGCAKRRWGSAQTSAPPHISQRAHGKEGNQQENHTQEEGEGALRSETAALKPRP